MYSYLFLTVLGLCCCMGFSVVTATGVILSIVSLHWLLIVVASLVAKHGRYSTGSVVVVHGFNRSAACGIFPDQGSNLCLLHWQVNSLPLSQQGSPWSFLLLPDKTWVSLTTMQWRQFTSLGGEGSIMFIAGPNREHRWLTLKRPKLPNSFQRQRFLKAAFGVRASRCMTFFGLVGGEVMGWCFRNLNH